ncbi:hypothetical protein BGZ65_009550, partial [Modicella reniformis]
MTEGFVLYLLVVLLLAFVAFAQRTLPPGKYKIKLQDGSKNVLRYKKYNGETITVFNSSGLPQTDVWDIQHDPLGHFVYIKNVYSNLFLHVRRSEGPPKGSLYLDKEHDTFEVAFDSGSSS